jgi:hypothetical protein
MKATRENYTAQKLKQKIIKRSAIASALLIGALLTGCASQSLKAPCPNYGKQCNKTPINSWDTSAV